MEVNFKFILWNNEYSRWEYWENDTAMAYLNGVTRDEVPTGFPWTSLVEFKVNYDTQACDKQGGSDIHFFVNVLARTTNVYLEYNLDGENWQREDPPYSVAEGENDLLFAINGTPPFDIDLLIRFVDVDNELTSEIYEWTLFSCSSAYYFELNEIFVKVKIAYFMVSSYVNYNNTNTRTFILEIYNGAEWVSVGDFQPPHPQPAEPIIQNDDAIFQVDYDLLVDGSSYRIVGRDGDYNQLRTNGAVYTKPQPD